MLTLSKNIFYAISNNIMFGIHLQSKKICIPESNAVNCKHIRNVYKYVHTQNTLVVFSSTQQRQQIWWYFTLCTSTKSIYHKYIHFLITCIYIYIYIYIYYDT